MARDFSKGAYRAYLICDYVKVGMFSNESILEFKDSKENLHDGFFQNFMISEWEGKKKLLEVIVSGEYPDGMLIHINPACDVFGNPPSNNQFVKREQIIYQEELSRLN